MITVGLNVDTSLNYLLVVLFTMLFMMFFVIGPGTIPWVATGELFIQGPRAAATSVCTFLNWTGGMIVTLAFPQLMNCVSNFSLLPFMTVSLIFLVLQLFYFPETKNRSSRELAALFQVPGAWKTAIGFVCVSEKQICTKSSKYSSINNYGSILEEEEKSNS